jgi:membrane-bound serine protease (ClpP class)
VFVLTVSSVALKARRRPVVTGSEALIGSIGVMLDEPTPGDGGSEATGWARVHGEQWRVRSDGPLVRGCGVRVLGRHGLILNVVRLDAAQSADPAQPRQRTRDASREASTTQPPQQGEMR